MGLSIDKIDDNECFEYKGDVHVTGSIGKNATVIIKDGSLTVSGDVQDSAEIKLQASSSMVISSNTIFIGGAATRGTRITIEGNVENNVIISSKNADFDINGNIGNNCRFDSQNGDIQATNIGDGSTLKTMNGNVKIGNIGSNCTIETMNGDVKAEIVASNSSLKSMNGDVKVKSADRSVTLKTMNGNVYENGVKRRKEKARHQGASISIVGGSSMSFTSGRIIVNGRDITDIVNSTSNQDNSKTQEPIRYRKGF